MSKFPKAIKPEMVGEYDAFCYSGGGYFYDEVLEYRVWCHSAEGAPDDFEDGDYFYPFETYEEALAFSESRADAEKPLVLVRQNEYIGESELGQFEHFKEERITEWQVEWLADSKREADSIVKFLEENNKK